MSAPEPSESREVSPRTWHTDVMSDFDQKGRKEVEEQMEGAEGEIMSEDNFKEKHHMKRS